MKKYFLTLIAASVLFACGNENEQNDELSDEITTDSLIEIVEPVYDEDVSYTLPSPLQIAFLFKNSGLSYQAGITFDPSKAEHFNTKDKQMLIMGVYAADMAYNVLNNQTQEAINYLKVMSDLSEKLWMTSVFNNNNLYNRFEQNIGNKDSLAYIIADMQMELDDYLEENEMGNTSAIIFAGAWIESMYLAAQTSDLNDNKKLNAKLSEQAIILESLIKLLEREKEPAIQSLTEKLKDLQTVLKPIDDDAGIPELSTEELHQIKQKIETIRNEIIS